MAARFSSLGDDPFGEVAPFANAQTLAEVDAVLRSQVQSEVQSILDAVAGFDAFDVIELLRLREFPVSPVLAVETGHDGNAAALELVALVLLSRDSRTGSDIATSAAQPHEVIEELHRRATRLTRLSSYWALASARLRGNTPLAKIAAAYQSYFVGVRRLRYDSIEDAHDEALFGSPAMNDLLMEHLGFTYGEFLQVRDTVGAIYSAGLERVRDSVADFTTKWSARADAPPDFEIDAFRQAMTDMLFLPGQRAAFTASAVAAASGVSPSTASAVLRRFSTGFGLLGDPVDVVTAFLRGRNPMALVCLMADGDGYIQVSGPLGSDSFRSLVESATKGSKSWERYSKARTTCSEALAVDALERLLGTSATRVNLKYWAPAPDREVESLGQDRADSFQQGVLAEADALFLIEDVAVCLEVKGRTIADAARRGDLARLETEIKNTIGSGAAQARRLESLIRINGGLWLDDGSWMDLSGVREIRSVVVGLDFFGPLSVGLGDLQAADLLAAGSPPWVVSIHDLEVISRVLQRPSEFLLYLRRRTDSGVTQFFRGADELDLFMLFMDGGLYVAADPDEVQRTHPRTAAPSRRSKREHRRDAQPTFVGTHTDPLDRWIYWAEGSSPFEAPKPQFNAPAEILQIIDFLREGRKPGWFRFGADLLGLSGEVQLGIVAAIDGLVDQSRADHGFHTLVHGYAGMWGHPTFFVATFPKEMPAGEAGDRLYTYVAAKKHQQRSDRSLGLLIDEHGLISAVLYLNDVPSDSEELDRAGRALGLHEPPAARTSPTNTARRDRAKRERARRRR